MSADTERRARDLLMEAASQTVPWDDADVERFIDRLGQFGAKAYLAEGSETWDPKDAVDLEPEEAVEALPPDLLVGFMTNRRDLACYLRGLRGARRAAAVAEARSEARRALRPLMQQMAHWGFLDEPPDDDFEPRKGS
jgi:hypothetical protein